MQLTFGPLYTMMILATALGVQATAAAMRQHLAPQELGKGRGNDLSLSDSVAPHPHVLEILRHTLRAGLNAARLRSVQGKAGTGAHLRWVYSRKRAVSFSLSGDRSKFSSGATWK